MRSSSHLDESKTLSTTSRPRSALFEYQPPAIKLMAEKRQLVCMMRMGLGKTVCTETALHDLGRPRTLIAAPAAVVEDNVWGKEARAWTHLKDWPVFSIEGTPKQRGAALDAATRCPTAIEVVSYENLLWLTDQVDVEERYGALGFDELSRMKHAGTKRFKRMRSRSGGCNIPIRFGLTGTPVGNHLLDVWAELFITCGEAPLGPRFVDFQTRYFHAFDPDQRNWEINYGADAEILERIKPYCFSLDEKLAAGRVPELRVNEIDVPLPPNVVKLERDLAKKAVATLDSGTELEALGASQLAIRLRQLASGAVYTDPLDESKWEEVHSAKLDRLAEIIESAQGEPILVFYWFRHELERLRRRFPDAGLASSKADRDAWNARKLEVMLAHPASAGHGLNLQHGGSTIVWFTLPYSLELWMQANARLARTGQMAPYVVAHCLLAGAGDRAVLALLRKKERAEKAVMRGVELLSADPIFS